MKNKFVLSAILMALLTIPVLSQKIDKRFEAGLSGALVIPAGDFGSTDGENAGFAKIGGGALVDGRLLLGESFGWFSTIAFNINPFDEDAVYEDGDFATLEADNYFQSWLLTGVGFEAPASKDTRIYGTGQVGVLFSNYPDVTLDTDIGNVEMTTDMASAFAFGLGAGVKYKNFNFGLRYFSSNPEYEHTYNVAEFSEEAQTEKISTSAFFVTVGVLF